MSRLAWTDPAPLKVERPRLPWWTLLPRKFLLAVSPVIVVVVLVMVLVFLARRVWRYPLFLIGGTVLAGLGVGSSWWVPVTLAAGLAVAGGLWAWAHPDSFERIAARQARSEWRRALVYAWPWKRVMLFWDLTKRTGHRQRQSAPRYRRSTSRHQPPPRPNPPAPGPDRAATVAGGPDPAPVTTARSASYDQPDSPADENQRATPPSHRPQ